MGASSLTSEDLKEIMAELGLVQEDLAETLHVRQSAVSRWLGGQRRVPGYVEAWLREAHPEVMNEMWGKKR